jgi:hypothetical protein
MPRQRRVPGLRKKQHLPARVFHKHRKPPEVTVSHSRALSKNEQAGGRGTQVFEES